MIFFVSYNHQIYNAEVLVRGLRTANAKYAKVVYVDFPNLLERKPSKVILLKVIKKTYPQVEEVKFLTTKQVLYSDVYVDINPSTWSDKTSTVKYADYVNAIIRPGIEEEDFDWSMY